MDLQTTHSSSQSCMHDVSAFQLRSRVYFLPDKVRIPGEVSSSTIIAVERKIQLSFKPILRRGVTQFAIVLFEPQRDNCQLLGNTSTQSVGPKQSTCMLRLSYGKFYDQLATELPKDRETVERERSCVNTEELWETSEEYHCGNNSGPYGEGSIRRSSIGSAPVESEVGPQLCRQ